MGNSSHQATLHGNWSDVAELQRFSDFFQMANVCHLGLVQLYACLDHREEHLLVFVVVQHLVGTDEVVFDNGTVY